MDGSILSATKPNYTPLKQGGEIKKKGNKVCVIFKVLHVTHIGRRESYTYEFILDSII